MCVKVRLIVRVSLVCTTQAVCWRCVWCKTCDMYHRCSTQTVHFHLDNTTITTTLHVQSYLHLDICCHVLFLACHHLLMVACCIPFCSPKPSVSQWYFFTTYTYNSSAPSTVGTAIVVELVSFPFDWVLRWRTNTGSYVFLKLDWPPYFCFFLSGS